MYVQTLHKNITIGTDEKYFIRRVQTQKAIRHQNECMYLLKCGT